MIRPEYTFYKANILKILVFIFVSGPLSGQTVTDTLPAEATLSQCINYALGNQALIRQSVIDENITKRNIRISLSGWYPQLELNANVQHYLQIPMTTYPNLYDPSAPPVQFPAASSYSSSALFSANQILYSNNLLYAARTSGDLRKQALENTRKTRIDIYVEVTKAFFDILLTEEQLKVLDEDILRLRRNYSDAYSLYQNGLTDNIDYQRASIALSNVGAQRRSVEESLKAKFAVLKQAMGVNPEKQLALSYDSAQYENEILIDTAKVLDYNNRVEYQLLQSALSLQNSQVNYYRYSFIPTLSAFYNHASQFGNSQLSGLYDKSYPNSLLGMKLSFPLFQGLYRVNNLSRARLQYSRLQLGMDYLKSEINSEYNFALSRYISNLNELKIAKNNITVAKNIFNTVKLQYDRGIKAYIEVLVSETDLRSSELNYLNLLFQVLVSKIDMQKALGIIEVN